MKTLLFVSIFLLTSFCGISQENNFNGKIGFTINDLEVLSMPESFRNVPIHIEDGGGQNTAIIGKSSYQNWIVIPTIGLDFEHRFKNNMSIGAGLNLEFSWANREEVNYNSSGSPQRGFGTALTFSGTISRGMFSLLFCTQSDDPNTIPTTLNFSLTPNIFFSIPINDYSDIKVNLTYQRYAAINGWDRYNSLEIYQKKTLVYIIPIDILFSFKSVEFGPRIPINFKTNDGKDFNTKVFLLGFVFNYKIGNDGD